MWVDGQAQIAEGVLHLAAAVERDALIDAVGDVRAAQRVLDRTREGVLTVEHRKVAVVGILAEMDVLDGVGYAATFVLLVGAVQQAYAVAFGVVAPELFLYLVAVVVNDAVGRRHDVLRRAVVLFQFEELHLRVIALEVKDILYVGSAEGVNALCVVAHDADVLVACRQLLDDEILCIVGVLILVHHDVLETLLVFQQHVGEVAQQDIHVEQQVVEVHGVAVV